MTGDGVAGGWWLQRKAILRDRDTYDYAFTEWIYGPTAPTPEEGPPMFSKIPLASLDVSDLTDKAEVSSELASAR
ncbi:hypothetical protein [Streptomyces sp. NBC_00154]|uniref:hypothetical protein n=1 Tax=Streptomyces sp. NBC_00154 TaxID=2975670 RepID=UPI00224DD045|nr:hypothetical protein [Streptomyces sp. NBC_00154]MCX5317889.1 hypothetical protein [Streptomyces sp. NBC_00154]